MYDIYIYAYMCICAYICIYNKNVIIICYNYCIEKFSRNTSNYMEMQIVTIPLIYLTYSF